MPFFLVFSFLNEEILESSEVLLANVSPPKVVFIFYFTSIFSYILTFANGGNFVDDFAEV